MSTSRKPKQLQRQGLIVNGQVINVSVLGPQGTVAHTIKKPTVSDTRSAISFRPLVPGDYVITYTIGNNTKTFDITVLDTF